MYSYLLVLYSIDKYIFMFKYRSSSLPISYFPSTHWQSLHGSSTRLCPAQQMSQRDPMFAQAGGFF